MKHSADEDRFGLAAYKRNGFIDASDEAEGVSRTLEYAYDDWTIAQVARRLGREDDYARYTVRSQAYQHLFDPSTGFMRPRVEGFWLEPFEPREVNNHYTEGNAWHYSFFVPQDVEGLMRLMGGPEKFAANIDALFSADSRTTGREQADITGMIGQYAHGNEPSHRMAYLYAYAGQPWKTQAMVRRILDTLYANDPDGLSGNEDCGQMSAWYILSALGFYAVTPGSTQYVIGSPRFDSATINLENGQRFVVRASGASAGASYIRSARLNDAVHGRSFLEHAAIANGGELTFEMSSTPAPSWGAGGSGRAHEPLAAVATPAPFVATGEPTFRGTQLVTLGNADQDAVIRYTVDGQLPTDASTRYTAPIPVRDDTPDRKQIYLNDGKGRFTVAGTWGVPAWSTRNASVADLNGDGQPDAIAANRPGPSFVCLNKGSGQFGADCMAIPAQSTTTGVAADFNQDGFVDLAVPGRDGGQSQIYFNDGKGNFATRSSFGAPDATARMAAAGDFNRDGAVDLVMTDERGTSMTVYVNDGKGSLTAGFQVRDVKRVPYAISAGDLNADGSPDIAIGYVEAPSAVFFNDGTGQQFTPGDLRRRKGDRVRLRHR